MKHFFRKLISPFGIDVARKPSNLIRNREKNIEIDFDFVISDYLVRRGSRKGVTIIQLGAYDGCTSDEVYPYIDKFNWEGLLVEPQKKYFDRLKKTYEGKKRLRFMQAAVSQDGKEKTLYTIRDPESKGMPDIAPRIASFEKDTILSHRDKIPNIEERINKERVKSMHLMDMIRKFSLEDVEIIQIDVEGFDAQVVKMVDFSTVSPSIIRFEHKHLSKKEHNEAIGILLENEYTVAKEPGNTIAYRREEVFSDN